VKNLFAYQHMPARFMITGSRHWTDRETIERWIERLRSVAVMGIGANDHRTIWGIGDCPTGADHIGYNILTACGLHVRRFEADWDRHGKMGGPLRNNEMVATIQPTHTIAFMHPTSKGTVGCADRAQPMSRVYRIYGRNHFTSTQAGDPVPPPFDWSLLSVPHAPVRNPRS
jgi:hypothetical protein